MLKATEDIRNRKAERRTFFLKNLEQKRQLNITEKFKLMRGIK